MLLFAVHARPANILRKASKSCSDQIKRTLIECFPCRRTVHKTTHPARFALLATRPAQTPTQLHVTNALLERFLTRLQRLESVATVLLANTAGR